VVVLGEVLLTREGFDHRKMILFAYIIWLIILDGHYRREVRRSDKKEETQLGGFETSKSKEIKGELS